MAEKVNENPTNYKWVETKINPQEWMMAGYEVRDVATLPETWPWYLHLLAYLIWRSMVFSWLKMILQSWGAKSPYSRVMVLVPDEKTEIE